ncbi:MAG TPA: AAA family ATPase [Gaiellaceae bacterium]|nr:AAA family ATPase [Gaiellaceae bacterium]
MTENGGVVWQPTDGRRPPGERDPGVVETNVFNSIWNHRTLVLGSVLVFAVLGLLLTALRASEYAAEAGLVLRNPQSQSLLDTPSGEELRYVADQVAILKSVAVADRASALLAKAGEGPYDARQIQRKTTIGSNADSNYVIVRFAAGNPTSAAAGANAIVRAYRDLIRADLTASANTSLKRIDAAITDTTQSLATLSRAAGDVNARKQQELQALLSELRTRRTRILVNAKLAGDGVGLFSPAGLGKAQGVSWLSALAIAIVLGGLVGAGLAYWLDARKQAFSNWLEPEALLRVPAIAEIPDFTRERVTSKLPVLHSPGTESAEAFRLLASSVAPLREPGKTGRAPNRPRDESGRFAPTAPEFTSVAFVAGAFGDGTTTLTANTAFAAAQDGYRVLALDTDIEQQGLTRLLLGRAIAVDGADSTAEGLSNMLRHRASPETIQRVMGTGAGGTLSLLGPGTATRRRSDVFRAEQILSTLDSMQEEFDLVLIDVPPILQIAYADALLRSADTVVVVVRHRSEAASLKSVNDRLALLGAHPIGYVYNFAPSRQEAGRSVAKDVLGRAESVVDRSRTKKAVAP